MSATLKKKQVWAWGLYDWANSAYFTTVVAGFFPVFFKEYWSAGVAVSNSTFQLGLANSLSSLVLALAAPLLGAIADRTAGKVRFLGTFTFLGAVTTAAFYFVGQGEWLWAIALFVISGIGVSAANIFYDSLLVDVATPQETHFVSAFGFALGYLGGGVLFAINVAMTLWPHAFGLADAAAAVRMSFVTVAVWWALFTIPLLLFVRERQPPQAAGLASIGAGFRQLLATFHELRRLRVVFLFLAAYWLYIDGVNTVIRMAVDYGIALGFPSNSLIVALLITQFVAFPAALAYGWLGERIGAKAAILSAIAVYIAVTLWAVSINRVEEFYGLAIAIGLVQGGIQSLSRSFFARIIPADKAAEFFGFYNMLGKFAAILGPVLMGLVALAADSTRFSILAVSGLFIVGGVLLYFVDEQVGVQEAEALTQR